MSKKATAPSVHVVLDTNCLFTEAADKLICAEISSFIQKSLPDLGTQIHWYIPEIVKGERKFQMLERATKLLPTLGKLELLLGHALGITEDVLQSRVDEAIKRQIDSHSLKEIVADYSQIDWTRIVNAAVMRLPPFEPGEKEKGFRDAIVLEGFFQLAESLPKSPTSARIVLLSGDKLLADAAQGRIGDRTNITIAPDLDTLKSLLNAIASQLTQETVEKIVPRANELFFKPQDKETLYYQWEIRKKIDEEFRDQMRESPDSKFSVKVEKTLVGPTTFLSKEKQRLILSSKIVFQVAASERIAEPVLVQADDPRMFPTVTPSIGAGQFGVPMGTASPLVVRSNQPMGGPAFGRPAVGLGLGLYGAAAQDYTWREIVRRRGNKSFDVIWGVTLMRNGSLSNSKFDKIEFRSSTWED
jgi:hypothetical protein